MLQYWTNCVPLIVSLILLTIMTFLPCMSPYLNTLIKDKCSYLIKRSLLNQTLSIYDVTNITFFVMINEIYTATGHYLSHQYFQLVSTYDRFCNKVSNCLNSHVDLLPHCLLICIFYTAIRTPYGQRDVSSGLILRSSNLRSDRSNLSYQTSNFRFLTLN